MQALSDAMIDILASKYQVGDDGYGCRVEVDYIIAGFTDTGVQQDLNLAYGTLSVDTARQNPAGPNQYTSYNNPTYANDGNDGTYAYIETGITPPFETYLKSDLGAAYECTAFNLYIHNDTTAITDFQYSTDGTTWTSLTGVETGLRGSFPTGATFTFTAPITARYWALKASHTGTTLHSTHELARWEIQGTATVEEPDTLGTVSYRVESCSIDKSRRLTASQAEVEIALATDATPILLPTGQLTTNAPLRVYQWYGDPADEVLVFTGSIDEIGEGRDERHLRLVARDMMKRLIVQSITLTAPQGADEDGAVRTTANYVYLAMDVDAILDDLLDKAGVPTADRDITPTGYALDEFLGDDGASFAETIIGDERLTGLTGYDMWADETGVIHFGPVLASRSADSDTDPVADYSYVVGDYSTGDLTSGIVVRLDRGLDEYDLKTRVKVRGSLATAVPAWTETWSTGLLTLPVGIMYLPADSSHIYVLDRGTKKIYRIKQSDRTKDASGIWPKSVSADVTYPIGLSRDPSDATIFWVLEAPYWTTGGTTGNKIHKYNTSGTHLASYSLASGKWTAIKVSSSNIWLTNWTTDKVHKHSKVDGSSVASYTVTYASVAQTNPTGIAIDGTTMLVFFYGKNRFLILDESDPTTVDTTNALGVTSGVISTAGTKILGGEVDTTTHADLYADSDVLHRTWKFALTSPSTDEVYAEVVDTDLEDELGFLMSAADREHDTHPLDADHAFEIRRETLNISKLLSNRAQATETAMRRLDLLAHRAETLDVGTVGNPGLQRNDLIQATDAVTGVDALYMIDTLRSSMDTRGFFMTLALLPYSPAW